MEASDWVWVWIAAAVLLAVAELVTPFLFFMISFAAGAALAAVVAALGGGVAFQWLVFLVGSGAALAFLVPLGRRLAHSGDDDDVQGSNRWVGRVAVVLEDIPGEAHATGLVRLERAQWRAETDLDEPIAAGEQVEVVAVRGTRLVVAPSHDVQQVREAGS